jgi:SAM-dependent methyltransferase
LLSQRRRELVRTTLAARAGDRVLDVGCGPGFYVTELLEVVGRNGLVVGVDVSADMLAVATKRAEGHDNVELHEADATTLPVPDGSLVPLLEQYVAEQGGMSRAEAKAWADEQRKLGERGEFFFTVTQFCFTATRRD